MDTRRGTVVKAAALVGVAGVVAWALRRRAAGRRPPLRLVDPAPTSHHRSGSGTPLLLLHGITGTWRMWEPLLPQLEQRHDVLALTLLGHSGGAPLADGVAVSMEALVDGVESEMDRLGLDRAHLVGNSLGGWIAIELARRGRATSLVLFSPAGAWTQKSSLVRLVRGIRIGLVLATRLLPYLDRLVGSERIRNLMLAMQVAHPERVPPEVVASMLRASTEATVVPALLDILPGLELKPLPADHDYPIRLVWAEPDRMIPWDEFGVPMLEKLPGAELIRQPGIGHVPMSDDPELLVRLITEVTSAVDRAAQPDAAQWG